jgi:hypothetical protein
LERGIATQSPEGEGKGEGKESFFKDWMPCPFEVLSDESGIVKETIDESNKEPDVGNAQEDARNPVF